MARQRTNANLSSGEVTGGTIFFVVYLLVLPFATDPLFRLAELLLDINISAGMESAIYYYVLFAVTVIIFHGLLGRSTRTLLDNAVLAAKTLGMGLVTLYGLNELSYRLTHALINNQTNLNDVSISARIDAAPLSTLLIVLFLAPFVEEFLFRGLVFGGLRSRSRTVAYVVSSVLFAFLHVWQYAWGNQDAAYFWLMLQYLVPGAVLAWTYDHSGTLWTSVALHGLANALSVLASRL